MVAADVREGDPALDAAARQQRQREPGRRHHRAFDAALAARRSGSTTGHAPRDQCVGDREARHHVPRGATARDDREDSHVHTRVWRATDINMPNAASVTTSDDPPNDRNGSGKPVTGSKPERDTDVDERLHEEPDGDADRQQHAESIGRVERDREADERRAPRTARITVTAPIRPSSSPMIEKMKSVCANGQVAPLAPARAQAHAGDATVGDRRQRLHRLETFAVSPGPEVEEAEQAVHAVVGDEGHASSRAVTAIPAPRQRSCAAVHPPRTASTSTMPATTIVVPRFGWRISSTSQHEGQQQHRAQAARRSSDARCGPGQQVGDEQHQGQLRELGGLHRERAVAEPSRRPVARQTDAGHQHDDEQRDRGHEHRRREVPPAAVVDAHRDEHRDEPQRQPHDVASNVYQDDPVASSAVAADADSTITTPEQAEHHHDDEQAR